MRSLSELCAEAKEVGRTIDISGCRYGYHNRTKVDIGETEYYRFLAGFARVVQAKQVLEIGTHYGGSIMAMSRGVPGAKLVTVDITNKNVEAFATYPDVTRVRGDSLTPAVSAQVTALLSAPADLMYIDSLHTKEAVLANMEMYSKLRPRYIVLDDIHISDSMDDLWVYLRSRYETVDLSDIADRKRVGFGAVAL